MDPTISVSKGCFAFKNGTTRADKTIKRLTKYIDNRDIARPSLLDKTITDQEFYKVYRQTCTEFMNYIERLQRCSYAETIENLVEYIISSRTETSVKALDSREILPAAALMTGINQPDYLRQFETLSQSINEKHSARICLLHSRDCPTVKAAIQAMVYGLIESSSVPDDEDYDRRCLRRSQCTMRELTQWYQNNFNCYNVEQMELNYNERDQRNPDLLSCSTNKSHILIVVLSDFECFNSIVLQDLILILSSYSSRLPFVLVMGVATAVSAIQTTLPYHVMRKLKLKIFQTQSAPIVLNEILDKVLLLPKFSFHLSGKILKFLSHIFLYYDFSVHGFIQGFKYCLIEHFFQGNAYALCTNYTQSLLIISSLEHNDLELIRRLLSFRPYVENLGDNRSIILILTDDNYLKEKLPSLLRDCHIYFSLFRIFLEFLFVLVEDLPKCPLGKQRRELYSVCLTKNIIVEPEFKECWQVLNFMSKEEMIAKFQKSSEGAEKVASTILEYSPDLAHDIQQIVNEKLSIVNQFLTKLNIATKQKISDQVGVTKAEQLKSVSRLELKEKLLKISTESKNALSEYSKSLMELLVYVQQEIVAKLLRPLSSAPPLHELFVFTDLTKLRRNIIGAPRAALHMALNNPNFYLQCKCCTLSEISQILPTLPDISVAYKLHLECGRMINLFDWLQAFNSVLEDDTEDAQQISPQVQARFTRAVAELQFLGYIKMSKRKTDHVTRLTW